MIAGLPVNGLDAYHNSRTTRALSVAESADQAQDDAALRKAASDFEALFLQRMLESMRRTVPQGGILSKSHAEQIYEGMLDEALSTTMASAGGIGLANLLLAQLAAARTGV